MRNVCFCLAVLLSLLPALAHAEDTPPSPAEASADSTKDQKDKQDKKDAKDERPAVSAPQAGAFDPAKVAGTPPQYPLKSDNFADIEDNYDDSDGAANIEPRSLTDIFTALQASSQDYLKAHVNPALTYVTVMNKPEVCRGEVVKLTGTLRHVAERELDPPCAGVTKYWRGEISVGAKNITSFISMEPLPPDVQIGRAVNVLGVFMKRFVYLNKQPGNQGTWTPLVIVRKLERAVDFEQPAVTWMNSPAGIAFFLVVGGCLAFYFWQRMGAGGKYPNRFTRMKEDRDGPQGAFPQAPEPEVNFEF